MVEGAHTIDGIDSKVTFGKSWDVSGKCASTHTRGPRQLFDDNIKLWIDYPNKLNVMVKSWFDSL
jgi:hypothetical protein